MREIIGEESIDTTRMHIPPATWGPFFWNAIHISALGYPVEPSHGHKKAAKEFFESLQYMIPCPICRDHYRAHLSKYPLLPHLDRRSDLFRWTLLLHNEVSKSLNKPQFTEEETLTYLKRLGEMDRSPIWTTDDFAEGDWKARTQGLVAGLAIGGLGCGLLIYLSTSK
jgi:hypothetical protein